MTESVLTRAVRSLRVAAGDDAAEPRYVLALRGVGYRFIAPVERDEASRDPAPLRSVAVFPFRSLSSDGRDEALELGLADTLIAHLSKWSHLVVRTLDSAGLRRRRGGDARLPPLRRRARLARPPRPRRPALRLVS